MNARVQPPVSGDCDPLRQCALVLHSIGAEDRKWLLANLTGTLVPELQHLLGELEALGIPSAPAVAQDALQGAIVKRSRAKTLGELLRHEPAGLIVRVMQERLPAEQKTVLACLQRSKRRDVKDKLSVSHANGPGARLAPRASAALQEQLAIRLALRSSAPECEPTRFGALRRLLQLLRFARAHP
jgi:hypothetical protein